MDIFKIRFVNKINKESTVLIISHSNEHAATEMAKMWLKNMSLNYSFEQQDIFCEKLNTDIPNVLSFSMP